jgi:hypothetical protein
VTPGGVSLEGAAEVAEELIGGRTATVREIAATRDSAARSSMVARVQAGRRSRLPGVYATTAMASGFADAGVLLPERLQAASLTAPLIDLSPGACRLGRVTDPSISDGNKQGLSGATIGMATGPSATSDANGFFEVHGLKPGGSFVPVSRSSRLTFRKQVGPLVARASFFLPVAMQK